MSYISEGNKKSHVSAGPWGGNCGTRWDDGVFGSIRQMIISHGAVIDAIQIEYDTMGCVVWSEMHGSCGGVKTEKVKLDYPDEYLISISGYYGNISDCGPVVVRSLMFESNKKRYGPFGFKKGIHFSFGLTGMKIVGFHGRSGYHLDSIGVYLKPFVSDTSVQAQALAQTQLGPGVVGNKSSDVMVGMRDMLISNSAFGEFERNKKAYTTSDQALKGLSYHKQIGREKEDYIFMPMPTLGETNEAINNHKMFTTLEAAKGIQNIRKVGKDGENYAFMPLVPAFSENAETNNHKLYFPTGSHVRGYSPTARQSTRETDDYMVEYETKVFTITYGAKGYLNTRTSAINNEDFRPSPNKNLSDNETREKTKVDGTPGGEKGYSHMRQSESTNMFMTNRVFGEYDTKDKLYAASTPQNTKGSPSGRPVMSCGPWGGNEGTFFDDGVHTGVRAIQLARSGGVVSIKVCYDMNGQAVWGNKNGGNGGFRLDKINLEYPDEFLTQISGHYGSILFRGPTVVKSLTFYTNKMKYGPFGDEQGTPFSSGQKDGIIVGFHGRKGEFLDCIGVHFLEGKQLPPQHYFDMYSTTTDMRNNDQNVVPRAAKCPIPCGPWLLPAQMVKEPPPFQSGHWGGPRDDGVFPGTRRIFLTK